MSASGVMEIYLVRHNALPAVARRCFVPGRVTS
jgi:hypothetical protein